MSFDSSRSANSKRSNDSNSSRRSKDSKKARQKTLGMAWGANSISASTKISPYANIGSYMDHKTRKLRDQFDADAGVSTSSNGIFHGISIFVDGFTIPSSQELRGYMLKYGGRFENYFSRHRVTHIICSNLPDSKLRNLRSFSGGLPVVNPMWILDSVAANKILNWIPYQLEQIANQTRSQQKLSSFFSLKSKSESGDAESLANVQEKVEIKMVGAVGMSSHGYEKSPETVMEEQPVKLESPAEDGDDSRVNEKSHMEEEELSSTYMEEEGNNKEAFQCHLDRTADAASSCSLDSKDGEEPAGSRKMGPTKISHSTLGDPNFVENYFKNSRLHFIGTWRNRYRKRFQHLLTESKCGNANSSSHRRSQRTIMHIDMDCFFVSVILRNHLELLDRPVAVCHSDNPKGTAEISSANYPARDFGVRAGIFVRDAKALCPQLVIFPYNFEAYEEVADKFYDVLHKYSNTVQAVSCDEAFLDVTDLEDNPENVASKIRQEIFETTGCTASAGIAGNLLMARLATKAAKPNGQYFIPFDKVDDYLKNLSIKALPGIGHVLAEKLKRQHIQTCGQLLLISKEALQKDFGSKTGDMLWNYSRGIDHRPVEVIQETKSIGAEVNWGVRFSDLKDSQGFLMKLCQEVSLRLQGCGMIGRTITLKVKKKKKDAGEPRKYMGCGDCDNLSHSVTVPSATDEVDVLQRISKQLFASFHIDVKEVRGVGLQVSRLESADLAKQEHGKNAMRAWLASSSSDAQEAKERANGGITLLVGSSSHTKGTSGEASSNQGSALPPISQLDLKVIESLPPELISEINEMYSGRLAHIIGQNKIMDESYTNHISTKLPQEIKGPRDKGKETVCSPNFMDNVSSEVKVKETMHTESHHGSVSGLRPTNMCISTSVSNHADLMPSSLSQVDASVLQELPEDLKADIIEILPAHRISELASDGAQGQMNREDSEGQIGFISKSNCWRGNPPQWVDKFKTIDCLILNVLAELYCKCGSNFLSSILQGFTSFLPFSFDSSCKEWGEALSSLCELLKDYIELKIESDVEEVYICFRLLKRLTIKSEFFLQVYKMVLPFLQAHVSDKYGGKLQL